MTEIIPPKHCPDCGGTNINYVALWHRSQWKCNPSDQNWKPFEGTSYDVWCKDCETSFYIFPNRHLGHYWYDEHPEDIPKEGNKHWNKILAQRNPPPERCGNCTHNADFTRFMDAPCGKLYRAGSYCELAGDEDSCWEKKDYVWYWETCHRSPNKWELHPSYQKAS